MRNISLISWPEKKNTSRNQLDPPGKTVVPWNMLMRDSIASGQESSGQRVLL